MSGVDWSYARLRAGKKPRLLILLSHKKPAGCIIDLSLTFIRLLDYVSASIEIQRSRYSTGGGAP
jgi:hypothetical protein